MKKSLTKDPRKGIYETCNQKLQTPEYSVQDLLKKMKVEVIGTTDDPADSLEYHQAIQKSGCADKVFPSFRPDQAMAIADPRRFKNYVEKLGRVRRYFHRNFYAISGCIKKPS